MNKAWLIDALERSLRAGAACLLSIFGVTGRFDIFTVDWRMTGGAALGAMAVSLLLSVVGSQVGTKGTAALLPAPAAPGVPHNKHEKN